MCTLLFFLLSQIASNGGHVEELELQLELNAAIFVQDCHTTLFDHASAIYKTNIPTDRVNNTDMVFCGVIVCEFRH